MTAERLVLDGSRVLIPRGGDLGDRLAAAVSLRGGEPVIAPIIEFREPSAPGPLSEECERLSSDAYDWVAVTSATTVEALVRHGVVIPQNTHVAVVGPATRDAMMAAGFRVNFLPTTEFSAAAMVAEWPDSSGSVLLPQSAIAEPTLADGLTARGLAVTTVTAYETAVVPWSERIRQRVAAGDFAAVLLTSASIARAIAAQCGLPGETLVVCIGDSTANGARAVGMPVHAIANQSTAESLVAALAVAVNQTTPPLKPKVLP